MGSLWGDGAWDDWPGYCRRGGRGTGDGGIRSCWADNRGSQGCGCRSGCDAHLLGGGGGGGVVGMPTGWVIGGVGGSGSATGLVGEAGWLVDGVGWLGVAIGLDGLLSVDGAVAWV